MKNPSHFYYQTKIPTTATQRINLTFYGKKKSNVVYLECRIYSMNVTLCSSEKGCGYDIYKDCLVKALYQVFPSCCNCNSDTELYHELEKLGYFVTVVNCLI